MREVRDGDPLHGPDWTALARNAFESSASVLNGCAPSAGSGDSVDVGSGTAASTGSEVSVSSQNVGLASRDSFKRYDLIVLDGAGNASDITGSEEKAPSLPAGDILVAVVEVPASGGPSITVLDARIITSNLFVEVLNARSIDINGTLTTNTLDITDILDLPQRSSDPSSPSAGQLWYRSDID